MCGLYGTAVGDKVASDLAKGIITRKPTWELPVSEISTIEVLPPFRFRLVRRGIPHLFRITKKDGSTLKIDVDASELWAAKIRSMMSR